MKHKIIIAMQIIFLFIIGILIYAFYPKTEASIDGNFVKFNSINANVIMISENPDFSNPRYLDFNERKNISLNLKPGKYYWKSDNGMIESIKHKFEIKSEVGLGIERNESESNLVNIGNVKISVTKNKKGVMVGNIILEPDENKKIDDKNEQYLGRETG